MALGAAMTTVDLPIGADQLTTECAAATARIRDDFAAARRAAAAWDLASRPARPRAIGADGAW